MSSALRIAHGAFGRVALLDMDRSLVRHAHPHCHVLIKAEGADTQFLVGDRLVELTETQAVLVNAWEPHAYVHDPRRTRTTILALYIEPEWLERFQTGWSSGGVRGFFEQPAGELSARIRQIGMDLAAVMVSDPSADSVQEQLLSDLMIAVIERFTRWRELSVRLRAAQHHSQDWRIRRAIELVRQQPLMAQDTSTLAREVGLSRTHFYRLFARSTRMTPHVYVNLLRMEMAVNSLVSSADPLCEVGGRLGFSAAGHFTRFFRDHAGVKPSEFRRVARLNAAPVAAAS
jgi:AraC-like DNA-binding protein